MSELTADGTDDGAYRFRLDDLSGLPDAAIRLALRTARHITADLEHEQARRNQATPAAVDPDRLVSAAEAAPMLGTTADHVWEMMRHGKLPCVAVGKKYKRIPLAAIRALMVGQPVPAPRLRTPRIGRKTASLTE